MERPGTYLSSNLQIVLRLPEMAEPTTKIPISSIILDEEIYPRKGIDRKRVGMFAENIRDGFKFDPIEIEPHPDRPGKYRLLDGVHRWSAFKAVGAAEPDAIIIKDLDGTDPLLYAAKKAIGPGQLTEDEARDIARRAYSKNTGLRSADIGKAIGRARRSGLIHSRSQGHNPVGHRHQDISHERSRHSTG